MLMQKSLLQYGIIIRKNDTKQGKSCDDNNQERLGRRDFDSNLFRNDIHNEDIEKARVREEERELERENNEKELSRKKEKKEKLYNGMNAWLSMRLQLLAHSTHIARENSDLNSAINTLCAMVRLMGDLEKRQQKQLQAWSNSISFNDNKIDNNISILKHDQNDNYDSNISEIGEVNELKNVYTLQSIGKLFISSEGRKIITTELIANKWILNNNENKYGNNNVYNDNNSSNNNNNNNNNNNCNTPTLSTRNISRIGFSSSAEDRKSVV